MCIYVCTGSADAFKTLKEMHKCAHTHTQRHTRTCVHWCWDQVKSHLPCWLRQDLSWGCRVQQLGLSFSMGKKKKAWTQIRVCTAVSWIPTYFLHCIYFFHTEKYTFITHHIQPCTPYLAMYNLSFSFLT